MKKVDVEEAITKYIAKNQFIVIDCMSKRYTISSYEEYVTFFNLISTTFQNNIIEYVNEAKVFLDNMNNFVTNAINSEINEPIEQYVERNIFSALGFNTYNRQKNIQSIYPESFLMQRECSQEAFINIYSELGYDMLKNYIELVKSPSYFSSYLNDSNKQILAMKYLLFKTDHHSSTRLKRDYSAKTIYQEISSNITETVSTITKEKDDFVSYMNDEKEKYSNWFENTTKELEDFKAKHSTELLNLESTYEEKLKIEKPAEFMLEQANKYKNSFYLWSLAIVILLLLLVTIVSPSIMFNDKIVTINVLSKDISVYNSVVLLAIVSIIVYVLRIFIKMAISSKHLMEEYKQKYSLTYFYLSLVNNGNIEDEKSRNIILTSLFTKADTGLIKNDNSSDNEKSLLSQLIK